jgi:RNA 2',3'-cyclic 3'-phosphodiesterase
MRLFVAIDIDERTREQLTAARQAMERALATAAAAAPPKITWQRPEAAHVTLRFIGEVSETDGARIHEALATPFPVRPFDVRWDRTGAFPNPRRPRVLWVGPTEVEPLGALAALVRNRLSRLAPREDDRAFTPHLTIGRVRADGRGVRWSHVLASIAWQPTVTRVTHVTLFVSRLSPKGSTYTALVTSPLDG